MENKTKSKFVKIFDPRMWFFDFAKLTGLIPALPFLRARKIFLEKEKNWNKGDYIIAANHVAISDATVLLATIFSRRLCFVTKEPKNKFCKGMLKAFGSITIDSQTPSIQSFRNVQKAIRYGHPVVVFPEQAINQTNQLQDFKTGIVMMAALANVPILPIYIVKKEKRKRRTVVIGKKLYWRQYCSGPIPTLDEMNKIAQVLKDKEIELELKYKEIIRNKYGQNI